MVAKRIECVPIVDQDDQIVDALFWEDIFGDRYMQGVKKLSVPVAIMAGGEGTRLSPFTKILPKPLVPVNEKPIIEVIMDNFGTFGCETFYLLLGYKGVMVKSYFDNTHVPYKTVYKFEKKPSGTAGALRALPQKRLGHSLFVSNCDIIIKADYSDIYDFHISSDCDITIVGAMRHFVIPYGILKMKAGGGIEDLVEKPEYNFFVNTGMYVVKSSVLCEIPKKGIFNFTDLIAKVRSRGGKIAVYPISEKSWFDIGQLELWQETSSYFSGEFRKDKVL
jgi:NDP-sugar pyrophosphorylase family protein